MSTLELPASSVLAGRFRVSRRIGAGGMGAVFEALDVSIERPVALKVLREGASADPQQLARFEREARAAARLSHPNVVGVSELVRDPSVGPILVMELLPGRSLATRIQEEGRLPEIDVVRIGTQALEGLASAHAAGMVHRDLKPSNLFLVPIAGGVLVKVLDFGIVKMLEEGALPKLTQRGMIIGTPAYMSPEQLQCDPVDARSDVYSMGACLYEAVTGVCPYAASHTLELIAHVGRGPPRDVVERRPDVSPDLAEVIRVAMARDRDHRYQSASAMRAALGGVVLRPRATAPVPLVRARPTDVTLDARPPRPAPVVEAPAAPVAAPALAASPAPAASPALAASPAPRAAAKPRRPAMLTGAALLVVVASVLTWWAAHRAPAPIASPPARALPAPPPSAPPPSPSAAAPPAPMGPLPVVVPPPAPPIAPHPARPHPSRPPRAVAATAPPAPVSPPSPSRPPSPIGHELMDPFRD